MEQPENIDFPMLNNNPKIATCTLYLAKIFRIPITIRKRCKRRSYVILKVLSNNTNLMLIAVNLKFRYDNYRNFLVPNISLDSAETGSNSMWQGKTFVIFRVCLQKLFEYNKKILAIFCLKLENFIFPLQILIFVE